MEEDTSATTVEGERERDEGRVARADSEDGEHAHAIELIAQMGFPRDEAARVLRATSGNVDRAMQVLVDAGGVTSVGVGVAPEASRRAAAGPGPLQTTPPDPPAPHRLVTRARELRASGDLAKMVKEAAAKTLVSTKGGRLESPTLDAVARTSLPLLRAICDQPSSFQMLLAEDWRRKAKEQCRAQLRAREAAVRSARIRVARARSAMVTATIESTMASGRENVVAVATATRANLVLQRHIVSLDRAETARSRAAAELKQAELQEQNPAWP